MAQTIITRYGADRRKPSGERLRSVRRPELTPKAEITNIATPSKRPARLSANSDPVFTTPVLQRAQPIT